ncbi:DNA-binding response regulator, NarL/FixJ family, contains REC and HTH domains [Monaibacterium marinum]|uniref:DNA-binding response regulator, NarL/FixJ family, contains REC and HTH domains n=1 Tax=Pontivivens marinum TaxID=1690039 RepID=A0A2C9CRZ2_9RHOB|nr:response regulator transcription factor [Monaibacterium marinum]SOH93973.1 DNA-binding response regulator, NarL/FixJ family, contains REC and HTH domains [Monaibacterium marinum]
MSDSDISSVLIVEDRIHTADRLCAAVNAHPKLTVIGEAHLVERGLELLQQLRPRLLLTDLGLPDGSGVDLIRAASAADWDCDSLVVSVFGDEHRVISAIRAGARGYILKSAPSMDIGESMQSIIEGGSPMSPQIARFLLNLVGPERPDGMENADIGLTQREQEVLQAVARGYRRQEIADRLSISVGTVGNHVNAIYRKLEVSSNIEAVIQATRMGLL